jgi:four helix bundle protein
LLEANASFFHVIGEPVVLIQAYAGCKRKIGTNPDEHGPELPVIQVKVVLIDPTIFELEMTTAGVLGFDADKNPSRLSSLDDRYDLIWLCVSEIGSDKIIAPVVWRIKNGSLPGRGPVGHPVLVLACDVTKNIPGDGVDLSVRAEEANDSFRLLKRLDRRIEKHPVKAAIMETDVILMVLIEGVHGRIPPMVWQLSGRIHYERLLLAGGIMEPERQKARTFRDLMVWRKAHEFVLEVYRFTSTFPKSEIYGLAQQMRRAAVSIPANIAEGFTRRGKTDKARFMNIAESSLEESRYYLILAPDLGYGQTDHLMNSAEEVSRLLNAYARAILASGS